MTHGALILDDHTKNALHGAPLPSNPSWSTVIQSLYGKGNIFWGYANIYRYVFFGMADLLDIFCVWLIYHIFFFFFGKH